ncbi:hypothetical protein [Streptomyces sp. NPDC001480]
MSRLRELPWFTAADGWGRRTVAGGPWSATGNGESAAKGAVALGARAV